MNSLSQQLREWSLKHRLFAVCGLCVGVGTACLLVKPPDLAYTPISPSASTFELSRQEQAVTAGPLIFYVSALEVIYPPAMRENQTVTVGINYRLQTRMVREPADPLPKSDSEADARDLDHMNGEMSVGIESSGFEVKPEAAFSVKSNEKLPFQARWTITPKSEGDHLLLLRINEKLSGTFADLFPKISSGTGAGPSSARVRAKINDQDIRPSEEGVYQLPIKVNSFCESRPGTHPID